MGKGEKKGGSVCMIYCAEARELMRNRDSGPSIDSSLVPLLLSPNIWIQVKGKEERRVGG
jgi:hypothetical protein